MRHNLYGKSLHGWSIVLLFFPVPPSLRQAAGPLTENLPSVLTGNRRTVDLSLERPSPRGTKRCLSSRVFATAVGNGWLSHLSRIFEFHAGSRGEVDDQKGPSC